ncbi:MAG: Polyphosphate kinase 2 (PPK2) [Methanomethylovorans sp. PtaU1.Bin093]|uniref:polyphosphate:AMP phosphotransferase n=1 Tax=Methanomethylovorans sp. PtaU1.Bin093 TaxID=1811679 RepID=UPI0009D293D6|nr:polyphosphate:AMP phosphotransferase [Methanomethylovorans sp. PtaU1.Bin093]OPY22067.1 MAG: Polyphosphate kinase 2 (PPK2) [Methanomethylovorans sp. PtaU1.Bin093]
MLESVDLSLRVSKEEYKSRIEDLYIRIGELQRKAWKMKIPIVIVFEGWHASGMAEIINRCILGLNPMGFKYHVTAKPTYEDLKKPLLWRFWHHIPAYGSIAIFDRSWYSRAVIEYFDRKGKNERFEHCVNRINVFERQLAEDGYLIIKFFMHITKEEQHKRFREYEKKAIPLCIVDEEIDYLNEYDNYLPFIDQILESTHREYAPWTVIEAEEFNHATVKVLSTAIRMMEEHIDKTINEPFKFFKDTVGKNAISSADLSVSRLSQADLSLKVEEDEYEKKKDFYQERLGELQYELFKKKIPMVVVFEGWDAAGKGGNIRRIARKLDPRLYSVEPVGVPNDLEKNHHYLWRFYREIPEAGHIAIFDRSWYGRVLVERVEGFSTEEQWKRAYNEINEFEETLADFGTIIVKFWLHIDESEQLRRFKERENTSYKQWKITPDDWRNREKWGEYSEAVDEMLLKTHTAHAPWTIVEANDKRYARLKSLKTLVETIEKEL